MSDIDPTKPTAGEATTQSVRDNFTAAKNEIEALDGGKAATADLTNHIDDHANPHAVTAAQVGADEAGAAAAVASDLAAHTGDTDNPHAVTAAQIGADEAGAAAAVQTNLDLGADHFLNLAAAPGAPTNGDVYYDTVTGHHRFKDATGWHNLLTIIAMFLTITSDLTVVAVDPIAIPDVPLVKDPAIIAKTRNLTQP